MAHKPTTEALASEERDHSNRRPQGISRREFIKLAAVVGLQSTALAALAGCGPTQQAVVTPTAAPTARPQPTLTPTPAHTPTPIPPPSETARRPAVIKVYPEVPSRVVRAHHADVWDGENLAPAAIRQMLDVSITALTGLDDASAAWAALFDSAERIAIKVNAFRNSVIWTHVPLVMAVTECLQEAGVPAEQIVIYDYYTRELETAGYPVNMDGPGVRCYGTDGNYAADWQLVGSNIQLSNVLLDCDALINIPILKAHMISGITFAMKNHYGSFDRPQSFHQPRIGRAIAELNALPPIKDRTRLIVGDVLTACLRYANSWPYWESDFTGDSILMSFDPVAHDTVGLQMFSQLLTDDEGDPAAAMSWANPWLEAGAKLGLGTNDPDSIELAEIELG